MSKLGGGGGEEGKQTDFILAVLGYVSRFVPFG